MAITFLTAVLVVVTGYYAWQNYLMVQEMRKSRGVQVLPRLAPTLDLMGAGNAKLRIVNVGLGPALDVDVQFSLEPEGQPRRWRVPMVVSGEGHSFVPAPGEQNGLFHLDQMTERFKAFHLQGSFRDVLGQEHGVDESIDIEEFWTLLKQAQRTVPKDHIQEIARRLEGIEKHLGAIARWMQLRGGPV